MLQTTPAKREQTPKRRDPDYRAARASINPYTTPKMTPNTEDSTRVLRHDSPWLNLKKSAQAIKAIGNTNGNVSAVGKASPNVSMNHASRKEPNPPLC